MTMTRTHLQELDEAISRGTPESRVRGAATEVVLASRPSDRLLDADHQPALCVEPALVDLAPPAEHRVADPDQRPGRELRPVLRRHRLEEGAVAVLSQEILRRRGLRERDELVRGSGIRARLDRRDRQLGDPGSMPADAGLAERRYAVAAGVGLPARLVLYWSTSIVSMLISSGTTALVARHAPTHHALRLFVLGLTFLAVSLVLWVAK